MEGCGFSPQNGGVLYVPAGTTAVYYTTAGAGLQDRGNVYDAGFTFGSVPKATIIPSGFEASGYGNTYCNVQIWIKSDTPECYPWQLLGLTEVGNSSVGAYYSFGPVVFYDPKIIGHAKAPDSLSFVNTSVNDSTRSSFYVVLDSLGQYRAFKALNVTPPFRIDSVSLQYPCISYGSNSNIAWFSPTKPGHYIDTAYLLDPLTNDSLPLILIGNAIAAGVAESTSDEPAMQVYPNPCDQFANIVLPSEGLEQVEIRNALGAVVQTYRNVNSDLMLDVSALQGGIYFIAARSEGAIVMKKLIVIH